MNYDEFQMSPCAHTLGAEQDFLAVKDQSRITKYFKHTHKSGYLATLNTAPRLGTRATNKVSSRLSVHFSNTGLE